MNSRTSRAGGRPAYGTAFTLHNKMMPMQHPFSVTDAKKNVGYGGRSAELTAEARRYKKLIVDITEGRNWVCLSSDGSEYCL